MNSEEAFEQIISIYEKLDCKGKTEVKELIQEVFKSGCCGADEHTETIQEIREYVKELMPVTGEVQTENISFPKVGEFKDCTTFDTAHVDLFLYDDDEVDELVEEGKLSYNTCTKCKSSEDVKEVSFISHSLPPDAIKHMLTHMLTDDDTNGKVFLDVGSRTGAILYLANIYRKESFKTITGIELNKELCELQRKVLTQFNISDVSIVEGDILKDEGLELLRTSDVIFFNNVFQFFQSEDWQREAWETFSKTLRKDTIIVTAPSLESTLGDLGMTLTWATPLPIPETDSEEAAMLHKYKIN